MKILSIGETSFFKINLTSYLNKVNIFIMNKDIKKLWTDALRSGKYEQGENYLHNNGKFCCLGVLTDLHIQEMPERIEWRHIRDNKYQCLDKHNLAMDSVLLLKATKEWSGLLDNTVIEKLTNLNDIKDYTFEQIADYIEANL